MRGRGGTGPVSNGIIELVEGGTRDPSVDEVMRLARTLNSPVGTQPTLREIVAQSVLVVPSDVAAALVAGRITDRQAQFAATTDEALTDVVAGVAGAAGTSPGWTAFDQGRTCLVSDLAAEQGYGAYPEQIVAMTPIRCVLSVPLIGDGKVVGVLTNYSHRVGAFGPVEVERAELLAEVAGLALTTASTEDRSLNLAKALESNRTIGAAMGILVERYRLSEDLAFDVLRACSRDHNRKLVDVAEALVLTGLLPDEQRNVHRLQGTKR
ncbi:GAF and ANTAR domain-containing protein [Knoellia sp. CPCC 206450]|uniref:GAF and ANTAR domain-containing protein n=1 Tax=Knoellia tibetensis TaxID=3404798 RepID=UPI003B439730